MEDVVETLIIKEIVPNEMPFNNRETITYYMIVTKKTDAEVHLYVNQTLGRAPSPQNLRPPSCLTNIGTLPVATWRLKLLPTAHTLYMYTHYIILNIDYY